MKQALSALTSAHGMIRSARNTSFCETFHAPFPTGRDDLDRMLGGGLPRGILCELTGPASCGRTAWLLNVLAETTRQGESVVYIDAFDSLDIGGLEKAGTDLDHLLWVRCNASSSDQASRRALKAADIVSQSGSFALIALDLQMMDETRFSPLPRHAWFRLQRTLKSGPTTLMVLQTASQTTGASALSFAFGRKQANWGDDDDAPSLLRGINGKIDLHRGGFLGQFEFSTFNALFD